MLGQVADVLGQVADVLGQVAHVLGPVEDVLGQVANVLGQVADGLMAAPTLQQEVQAADEDEHELPGAVEKRVADASLAAEEGVAAVAAV